MRSKFIFPRSNNSAGIGFTLIEVLIVVALIGILSTGFIIFINPKVQLEKSRDSQRKAHLRQIQSALEVYRADCGAYPASLGASLTAPASCSSSSIIYMQTVPVDPETKNAYLYCTNNPTNPCPNGTPATLQYALYACTENNSDLESLPNLNPPDNSPASPPGGLGCPPGTTKYFRYGNP